MVNLKWGFGRSCGSMRFPAMLNMIVLVNSKVDFCMAI